MWDERHAQRLYDISLAKNQHFIEDSKLYQAVKKFEIEHEHANFLKPIIKFTASTHRLNPFKPAFDLGGKPFLHSVGMWEGEDKIYIDNGDRNGHTIVFGTTRVGKTRLAETLISQDIRRGDVTIVIDPKGDGDLLMRVYTEALKAGRVDDLHIFHLGFPDISEGYNPIGSFMKETESASRVAGQMPGEGQSETFRQFVWGYVNTVCVALVEMGITPDYDILKSHTASIAPLFVEYMKWNLTNNPNASPHYQDGINFNMAQLRIDKKENRDPKFNAFPITKTLWSHSHEAIALFKYYKEHPEIWTSAGRNLCEKLDYKPSHMGKLIASLAPFLDKMTTGKVADMLCSVVLTLLQYVNQKWCSKPAAPLIF